MFSIERIHRDVVLRCDWRWLIVVLGVLVALTASAVCVNSFSVAKYYHDKCYAISVENNATLMQCKVDVAIAQQTMERYMSQVQKIYDTPQESYEIRGIQIPTGVGGEELSDKEIRKLKAKNKKG